MGIPPVANTESAPSVFPASASWLGRHVTGACRTLLVAVTFFVFSGALGHGFVNWDDGMFIVGNPTIRALDAEHLRQMFTTFEVGAYTPLARLSLAVDYAIWKLDPFGYHLTALLLHMANALLVFEIARRLLGRALPGSGGRRLDACALLAALLFAIHPMRVESVVWLSERRDVLSGFFALAATLCYLIHAAALTPGPDGRPVTPPRCRPWYPLAFVFFVLAVISKAVAVALPVAFLLLDVCPFGRLNRRGGMAVAARVIAEKIPFFFISLATGVLTFFGIFAADLAVPVWNVGLEQRVAQSLLANHVYLSKILLPIALNPLDKAGLVYRFSQQPVIVGAVVSGMVTLFLLALGRRHRAPLIAWLAWIAIIFPFLGVSQSGFQLTADRYTYLAAIPLAVLFGGLALHASARPDVRQLAGVTGVVVAAWFGFRTIEQTAVWRNSLTLWSHSISIEPRNPVAWQNYGDALFKAGRVQEAVLAFETALRLAPRSYEVWYNYGTTLDTLGPSRRQDAIAAMSKAVGWYPDYGMAQVTLGDMLFRERDLRGAARAYFAGLRTWPDPACMLNLGITLARLDRADLAVKHLAVAASRGNGAAYCVWATLLVQRGAAGRALELLEIGRRQTHHPEIDALAIRIIEADRSLTREKRDALKRRFAP